MPPTESSRIIDEHEPSYLSCSYLFILGCLSLTDTDTPFPRAEILMMIYFLYPTMYESVKCDITRIIIESVDSDAGATLSYTGDR